MAVEALEAVVAAWTDRVRRLGLDVKGLWLVDFDNGIVPLAVDLL